ncbi:MAG TPA: DUF4870 domain-containing protein [Ktedonobacterales bacterium]
MSGASIGDDSPLSVNLRSGGDVLIWPDRVTSGAEVYRLVDLTRAAVVSAPVTANVAVPGAGLVPALLLQLRDGRAPLFVPSDPPDASRMLASILHLRPDLSVDGDTSQGLGDTVTPPVRPPVSQSDGNGYANHGTVQWEGIAATDRLLAGLAHLSVFYAPLLVPLILWLALRGGSLYASRQAKQAFFFHILVLALVAVVIIPLLVVLVIGGLTVANSGGLHAGGATLSISSLICGGALMIALAIALSAYGVYGAVQAFMGKPFHYPLLRRL